MIGHSRTGHVPLNETRTLLMQNGRRLGAVSYKQTANFELFCICCRYLIFKFCTEYLLLNVILFKLDRLLQSSRSHLRILANSRFAWSIHLILNLYLFHTKDLTSCSMHEIIFIKYVDRILDYSKCLLSVFIFDFHLPSFSPRKIKPCSLHHW